MEPPEIPGPAVVQTAATTVVDLLKRIVRDPGQFTPPQRDIIFARALILLLEKDNDRSDIR